ncbi:hypothetical protein [Acidovorax sp. BLS4]|uniref:hypothetical protein n=1 Tax=Acidovorax sp. BLS4 TaxID=3273430 RepID=UPI002943C2AD|nr:hypothetical protein [Paracidovorax avenae]WOI46515.1 hypothetical protein R1Z03_04670 [Paracidovorax avenae]
MSNQSTQQNAPFRIESLDLPFSPRVRIDWFGPLEGGAEKSVVVVVSRWNGFLETIGDFEDRCLEVRLPIAFLPLLRIGDIWEKGVRCDRIERTRERFDSLQIDASTSKTFAIRANLASPPEPANFAIPFSQYDGYKKHLGSQVVRVQIDSTRFLVVPSMELFRFYFGASGLLLKTMVSGSVPPHELLSGARIDRQTGIANINLRQRMPRIAGPVLARIALDDAANYAFRQIISSGRTASINGEPWYPRMGFPISGSTNLEALGFWFEQGDEKTFVALQLLSCSHPFPFEKLFIHYQDSSGSDAPQKVTLNVRPKSAEGGDRRTLNLASRPISKSSGLTVSIDGDGEDPEPFPDLLNKPVKRGGDVQVTVRPIEELPPNSASLGGVQGHALHGADAVSSGRKWAVEIPDLLLLLIAMLEEKGWASIPFPNGTIATSLMTDALPSKSIGRCKVWFAPLQFRPDQKAEARYLALAVLDTPLLRDLPELAALNMQDGSAWDLTIRTKDVLAATQWGAAQGDAYEPTHEARYFSSAEIEEAISSSNLAVLLSDIEQLHGQGQPLTADLDAPLSD